jgi:hypothetical protein
LKFVSTQSAGIQSVFQRAFQTIPVWFKGSAVACFVLLLLTAISGFRNVHSEGGIWISTGHAGRWPVSETVARAFLWSSIRASSLTTLLMALTLSFVSSRVLSEIFPRENGLSSKEKT